MTKSSYSNCDESGLASPATFVVATATPCVATAIPFDATPKRFFANTRFHLERDQASVAVELTH